MLARVAENLYWMGRYLERIEFHSRYYKVQYFSTLEPPMSEHKDFALRSIIFMYDTSYNASTGMNDHQVLHEAYFGNSPDSIFNMIKIVRENARAIRNNISSELWESINKWFLFCKSPTLQNFTANNLYLFFEEMRSHIAVIKSNLVNTLLHNDIWHFLNMGMYLERAQQVFNILRLKISDYAILSNNGENQALLQYQYHTLLKCLEAFDVHQVQNRGRLMTQHSMFELILNNREFPRSIHYSLMKCFSHLNRVSVRPPQYDNVVLALKKEFDDFINFHNFGNEAQVIQHLDEMRLWSHKMHNEINQLFFQ